MIQLSIKFLPLSPCAKGYKYHGAEQNNDRVIRDRCITLLTDHQKIGIIDLLQQFQLSLFLIEGIGRLKLFEASPFQLPLFVLRYLMKFLIILKRTLVISHGAIDQRIRFINVIHGVKEIVE